MNLNITGKDVLGNVYTLPCPFWLSFDSDIDAPADSLALTFLNDTIPEIATITIQGDFLFNGIVDVISQTKSRTGGKTVIYARSIAAMLIDSEAMPGKMRLDDFEIIQDILCRGGKLKGFIYDTYTPMDSITLPKGSSLWYFLRLFCEQTMGHAPRITDDGYIKATALSDEVSHNFDEMAPISVEKNVDFSDIVTSVSVRNTIGNYSSVLLNQKVTLPYSRHRYTIPGGAWINNTDLAGKKVLNQSMTRYKTKTLEFEGFYSAKIAECAVFEGKEHRIISIKHTLNESGATTKITMSEKEYI